MEQPIPIHCSYGGADVTLDIKNSYSVEEVIDKCLAHSTAPNVIPKLYHPDGFLIPIGPNIPRNTENRRYKLEFTEGNCVLIS